jgi:tetratricopeptide (TPR) repeat protein
VRYSAFISYNHKDRAWAGWLHRKLEHYRIPDALIGRPSPVGPLERRLPQVFQDREELATSSNLAETVRKALSESANLIVICSTNAAKSRWVNEEVRAFCDLGRRDRIQCLIVPEGDSREDWPPHEIFPPALLETASEPLAADARESGDGKRAAFLKLVAGIVDVRFDELRQREHARRQKRLVALMAAALVGFILMSGLAAFAFVSRAAAVRERDVARQKTITAQRTTEFVKGLFQVSDPSESKGQSISALEMLDRGARQIEGELNNEPDVKAELVSTLSEVYMGLGSYRRADDLIRRSLALPVRERETRARQLAVLASSQTLQGNYESAVDLFRRAETSLKNTQGSSDPSLYSRILVGRAEALAAQEKYSEAKPLIVRALTLDRRIDGPHGPSVARDLEAAGLTAQLAGDLDPARRYYQQALAIRVTQGRLHPKVSEDLNELGTVAYLQHDPSAAEGYWRQSLALYEQVLGPTHPDLAAPLNNLGRVLVEQRKFRDALPLLSRSAALDLAQRSGTHDDLAFILSNLALAKRGVGDTAAADDLFKKALVAADAHQSRNRAPILVDLADLRCELGDPKDAMQLLARASPIMKASYPDDPWRAAWVENTRGACILRQGDRAGAKELLKASAKPILDRWPTSSLYGFEVKKRMRAAGLQVAD